MMGDPGGERFAAAGGRTNELSMPFAFSCADGSVEVAGVGGFFVRGMVSSQHEGTHMRVACQAKRRILIAKTYYCKQSRSLDCPSMLNKVSTLRPSLTCVDAHHSFEVSSVVCHHASS